MSINNDGIDFGAVLDYGRDEEASLIHLHSLIAESEAEVTECWYNIGFITTPSLIHEQTPVNNNTIIALKYLSRVLNNIGSYASDLLLLLSSFMFYIDAASQDTVKNMAQSIKQCKN